MKITLNTNQFDKWVELFPKIYENSYPVFMSGYCDWYEQKLNIVSFHDFMTIHITDIKVFENHRKSIYKILNN